MMMDGQGLFTSVVPFLTDVVKLAALVAVFVLAILCAIAVKKDRELRDTVVSIAKGVKEPSDEDRRRVRRGFRLGGHVVKWPGSWSSQEDAVIAGADIACKLWPDEQVLPLEWSPGYWRQRTGERPIISLRRWFSRCSSSIDRLILTDDVDWWPVWIEWRTRHLLVVGLSGSGKGSITANLMREAAPYIQKGIVRMSMIDLKGGMESAFMGSLLAEQATDIDSAAKLISRMRADCQARAREMAGVSRSHTPTPESPRQVLIIDEAGELFRQDRKTRESIINDLNAILATGRACGYIVWAMTQNPRVDSLPIRHGFTQSICLRVHDQTEAKMVLGEAAIRDGATPWAIVPSRPGTAWMYNDELGAAQLFRVPFVTDEELRHLGETD